MCCRLFFVTAARQSLRHFPQLDELPYDGLGLDAGQKGQMPSLLVHEHGS